MALFQKSVLRKYLHLVDHQKVNLAWTQFQAHFLNPQIQENIRNSKEEQYQGEFLIDLFVNVLGYTKNPQPNFNLTTEYKNEKDIHLAITWEMGDEWKKNYDATSFLDLENLHLRDFHGLTHVLDSGTTKFYVIALKELILFLNDVDGVQGYQKRKYGDDLF